MLITRRIRRTFAAHRFQRALVFAAAPCAVRWRDRGERVRERHVQRADDDWRIPLLSVYNGREYGDPIEMAHVSNDGAMVATFSAGAVTALRARRKRPESRDDRPAV